MKKIVIKQCGYFSSVCILISQPSKLAKQTVRSICQENKYSDQDLRSTKKIQRHKAQRHKLQNILTMFTWQYTRLAFLIFRIVCLKTPKKPTHHDHIYLIILSKKSTMSQTYLKFLINFLMNNLWNIFQSHHNEYI